jgi:Flp pilus assembly protein CpaB
MAVADALRIPRVDRRTLTAAGLAALAALLVLALTRPVSEVDVLVASRPIAAGTPLSADSVTSRRMVSAEGLVAGDSIGELDGWLLEATIAPGEPILRSQLVDPEGSTTPSALSVSLPEAHAALGSVQAGDLVDIYVTWPQVAGEARLTELLVAGVSVLETRPSDEPGGRRSIDILFAVDDELAPLIARGHRVGELDLVRVSP